MTAVCIVPRCNRGDGRPRETADDRYACGNCVAALRHTLRGIEVYAHILNIMVMPMQGRGERHSPGYGSRPPTNLDRLVALDYRSRTGGEGPDDEENPTRSILGTLHQIARWIREEQDLTAPRDITITTEIGFLLGAMEYAARQAWIDELANDLRNLHAQVRWQANDQPPSPIGHCPTLLDNDECRTPLYTPVRGEDIHCAGCGRIWPKAEWLRLSAVLTEGGAGDRAQAG